MGLKPPQKIFFENFSKTTAARGFQNFGTIEGAAVIPTEQWPKFVYQISSDAPELSSARIQLELEAFQLGSARLVGF